MANSYTWTRSSLRWVCVILDSCFFTSTRCSNIGKSEYMKLLSNVWLFSIHSDVIRVLNFILTSLYFVLFWHKAEIILNSNRQQKRWEVWSYPDKNLYKRIVSYFIKSILVYCPYFHVPMNLEKRMQDFTCAWCRWTRNRLIYNINSFKKLHLVVDNRFQTIPKRFLLCWA